MTYNQACPCGSGLITRWQYDRDHVPLFRTCRSCHQCKMAKYRDELRDKPLEPENDRGPGSRVIPHLIPPKDAGRVYGLHEYLALTVTDSGP